MALAPDQRRRAAIIALAVAGALAACEGNAKTPAIPVAPDRAADAGAGGGVVDATFPFKETGAAPPTSDPDDPYANCTWQAATGQVTANVTSNNGAELSLGEGAPAASDSTLQKMVPVKVTTPLAGFEIGPAWLFRSSDLVEDALLAMSVRNVGTAFSCFITVRNYHWRSSTGSEVADPATPPRDRSYVKGSVGELANGTTNTCLGPGETGHVSDIRLAPKDGRLFSDVDHIEFELAPGLAGRPAPTKLVPTGLQLGLCSGREVVGFQVENRGTESARVSTVSGGWAVLLNPAGVPLDWGFLHDDARQTIAPGKSATLRLLYADLPEGAFRAVVYTNFEPALAGARKLTIAAGAPPDVAARAADVDGLQAAVLRDWKRWRLRATEGSSRPGGGTR